MDTSSTCNFLDHSLTIGTICSTHYCYTCSLRLCSNCLLIHNSNPGYFSHKIEKINIYEKKWKQKLEEIERDKPFIKINNKEGEEIINTKKNTYAENLNELNNIFRKLVLDWYNKYNELENMKNYINTTIENKENLNYTETKKSIGEIYEGIINRQKEINDLLSTGEILQNFRQFNDLIKKYKNLSICSNVNNFYINKKEYDKEININQIGELSNNKIYFNVRNISNATDPIKNNETESIKKRKEIFPEIINKKENEEKNSKINDIAEFSDNKLNSKKNLKISLISNSEINDYINKKTKRERKKKECSFCDCCSNESHKKRKFDNLILNPTKENDELKKIKLIKKNNNEKTTKENKEINELNFFNFRIDEENNLCFVLLEINQSETKCKCFKGNNIIYKEKFLEWEKFPFLFSKIINVNNNAFIIGGKSSWNMDEKGNKLVLRLNYVNNSKSKDSLGEIICTPLANTKFSHQSHNLIYSEKYNSIFVISGHEQKGCEFGLLDKEKNSIKEWKEFNHIRSPRENAICFLLNEKYIFLIGGQGSNSTNYDVFDISSIFALDKPLIWKTYNFIINQFNKQIFNIPNAGIVYSSNDIFVLGGDRYNIKEYFNWKIEFTNDIDDENVDNYKRINNISLIKSNALENCNGTFHFYGQPMFMKFTNCFLNIDFFGEAIILPKNLFDELSK